MGSAMRAGQPLGGSRLAAAEVAEPCERLQHDRPAAFPGLAGQAFAAAETHAAADCAEAARAAVQPAAEFEQRAVGAGHPDFDDADECLRVHLNFVSRGRQKCSLPAWVAATRRRYLRSPAHARGAPDQHKTGMGFETAVRLLVQQRPRMGPAPADTTTALRCGRWRTRRTPPPCSVRQFGSAGARATTALRDSRWRTRSTPLQMLVGQFGSAGAGTATALRDSRWRTRSTPLQMLVGQFGSAGAGATTALRDSRWRTRSTPLQMLVGQFGSAGAGPIRGRQHGGERSAVFKPGSCRITGRAPRAWAGERGPGLPDPPRDGHADFGDADMGLHRSKQRLIQRSSSGRRVSGCSGPLEAPP